MQLNLKIIDGIIARSLEEDIGQGDITTRAIIPASARASFSFAARDRIVMCGGFIAGMVFKKLAADVRIRVLAEEGELIESGTKIITAEGKVQDILTAERVILNLLQHMAGIATFTRKFVDEVAGTKATIMDTRKTTPGLRVLEKYAVATGGGKNHRMRLDDGVLIKDNHISSCGGVKKAITRAKKATDMQIEVECDTIEQVSEAIEAGADILLLDNMSNEELREAVRINNGRVPLEASGGITLENVRAVAETGVNFISIGALTHSAPNADIGMDFEE